MAKISTAHVGTSCWGKGSQAHVAMWIRRVLVLAVMAAPALLAAQPTLGSSAPKNFAQRISAQQVAALFPTKAKSHVLANWPLVQRELARYGVADNRHVVIYALATIRVETGTFSPAPERPSKYSTKVDRPGYAGIQASGVERPFGAYDSTLRFKKDGTPIVNKQLGNCYYSGVDEQLMRSRHGVPARPECEDGILFRGRGFIQLTGRYNYEQMQKEVGTKVGVDILKNPDDAGKPEVAARILAVYVANRGAEIERLMMAKSYSDARKIVNKAALGLPEFEAFVAAAERGLR